MAFQFTCPQGHSYTLPENASVPTLHGPTRCPVCDAAATLPPAGPDEPLVSDLLSRWQEGFARGADVPAAELCRDRPDLIATLTQRIEAVRALNRLVVPHRTSPDLSAQPTAGSRSDTPPVPDAARPAPALPGYVILGELGRGGMGVVYKAQQTGLNRLVALKMILSGEYAGAAELQRFQVEAEAIARLQHPHIVQIHEVGTHHGLPYFSLEFCPGGSLDKKLNGTPLPPKEAARLVATLARAVQAAHRAGVVHRDLKPANVLLGEGGAPKLTDFGLAKRLHGEPGAATAGSLTQSGAVLGTPSYMAPEQAAGHTREVGPAADVYALGAVLYELLTGRPPFRAPTPLDTLVQVLEQQPAPPRLLNAAVERDLETVCLKCLEKDPAQRYATAEALAEDLERYLQGEAITARSLNLVGRLASALSHSQYDAQLGNYATMLFHFALIVLSVGLFSAWMHHTGQPAWMLSLTYLTMVVLLILLLWWYRGAHLIPSSAAERHLWSVWIGYVATELAVGTFSALSFGSTPGWELNIYPLFAAVTGLAFFALASNYWGWCYVFGLAFYALTPLMALNPRWAPVEFGALWAVVLVVIGLRLRRLDREARLRRG